jgi:hypothetical protein
MNPQLREAYGKVMYDAMREECARNESLPEVYRIMPEHDEISPAAREVNAAGAEAVVRAVVRVIQRNAGKMLEAANQINTTPPRVLLPGQTPAAVDQKLKFSVANKMKLIISSEALAGIAAALISDEVHGGNPELQDKLPLQDPADSQG